MSCQTPATWNPEDDWSGLSSAAERRKRQNRLNQRLSRQRKHQRPACGSPAVVVCADQPSDRMLLSNGRETYQQHVKASSACIQVGRERLSLIEFKTSIFSNFQLRIVPPSDLSTLTRLNVINGLASNALSLSIPILDLDRDDAISQFNVEGPRLSDAGQLKPLSKSLWPTILQRTVVHHPWIDVFPIPGMRDNLLRYTVADALDEDELCHDLFNAASSEDSIASLMVWGDPAEARSWEFSPEFLHKWRLLVRNCPEVMETTNFWRAARGKKSLNFLC